MMLGEFNEKVRTLIAYVPPRHFEPSLQAVVACYDDVDRFGFAALYIKRHLHMYSCRLVRLHPDRIRLVTYTGDQERVTRIEALDFCVTSADVLWLDKFDPPSDIGTIEIKGNPHPEPYNAASFAAVAALLSDAQLFSGLHHGIRLKIESRTKTGMVSAMKAEWSRRYPYTGKCPKCNLIPIPSFMAMPVLHCDYCGAIMAFDYVPKENDEPSE